MNEIRENAFLPAVGSALSIRELKELVATQEQDAHDESSALVIVDENCSEHSRAASISSPAHGVAPSTAIPSPIPFVARPRGSRANTSDDPNLYAVCQLCQNKIMSSRLSNLTNHVRRHASLKQFQCVYCVYTHNEMAKVGLLALVRSFKFVVQDGQQRYRIVLWPDYSRSCTVFTHLACSAKMYSDVDSRIQHQ